MSEPVRLDQSCREVLAGLMTRDLQDARRAELERMRLAEQARESETEQQEESK